MAQLAFDPVAEDAGHRAVDPAALSRIAGELEARGPQAAVDWALRTFAHDRVAVVTGLQADGVAVAAMALAADPRVRLLTIDTGRLHAETQEYLDRLRALWRRDIEVIRPAPARVVDLVGRGGPDLMYISHEDRLRCCAVRKVEPLDGVLIDVDAWMTGVRRDQTRTRSGVPVVQEDPQRPGVIKVNPLAGWTEAQVHGWLGEREIPLHPLYARGYRSIGCAPCTRAVEPGADARSGRWWWERGEASECGLHVVPTGAGSPA